MVRANPVHSLRPSDPVQLAYTGRSIPMSSQPRQMSIWNRGEGQDVGLAIVTVKDITLVANEAIVSTTPTSYEGQCVASSPDGALLAVGGLDNKLYIYSVSGTSLSEVRTYSWTLLFILFQFSISF